MGAGERDVFFRGYYNMLNKDQSKLYFLIGCIPMRIGLAVVPLYLDRTWLQYYSIILFTIALGLFYLYFTNQRLDAAEAGGNTWWANYRILHGSLYLTAAIYAFMKSQLASVALFCDVLLGIGLFIHHHYIQ